MCTNGTGHGVVGMSNTTGKYCGCLGCDNTAMVVIDHDQHGELYVCHLCKDGHEVVEVVGP